MESGATGAQPEVADGVRQGDILAGKYRIDKVLGVGGMGVVVAAHHVYLDEKFAIKFLHAEALENAEVVARFAQEARAAVKIKNDHVVRISDVGMLDNGAPYMVMEYLDGCDLSNWVESKGPLDVSLAIGFVLQACEALAEAHRLGIIHRDLKPSNLFCVRRPENRHHIKVLDFGISKTVNWKGPGHEVGITKTNAVMGSPLYMSPEQMQSARDVDLRTDIWAIGIIFHELLTGTSPFYGETLPEVCSKVISQRTPPLQEKRSDVPHELDRVIQKCLEKDRNNRYSDVAALANALEPFAPPNAQSTIERINSIVNGTALADSVVMPERPAEVPTRIATADTMSPPLSRTAPRLPRGTTGPFAAVLVVFACVLALGWWALGRRQGSVSASGTPSSLEPLAAPSTQSPALGNSAPASAESQSNGAPSASASKGVETDAAQHGPNPLEQSAPQAPSPKKQGKPLVPARPDSIASARVAKPTPIPSSSRVPSANTAQQAPQTTPTAKWGGRF